MTNHSLGLPERSTPALATFLAAGAADVGGSITATSSSSSGTELRPKRGNPADLRPPLVCPAIVTPYVSRPQGHRAPGAARTRTVDAPRPAPLRPVRAG